MTPYLLLTEFAPPDHGGIQSTIGPILESLGDSVTVITPHPILTRPRQINRSLFSGTIRPRWFWLVAFLYKARREGLKIAIFGHFSAAVMAGYICRRLFGLPYVVLIHGQDILSEKNRGFSKLFMKQILKQAKFVGVNSSFVERIVIDYGVRLHKIVYTHPFVRIPDSQIDKTPEIKTRKHLITVSRLVPRKNIVSIIQALSDLQKRIPDIHLDIIGDGPERGELVMVANELKVINLVTFHGQVVESEKWKLLEQADVFILIPIVRDKGIDVEGLGLVFLEAAACGLPVVASDTGGINNAVKDKQTGLLVNPNDATSVAESIFQLLNNPELAHQYGISGLKLVRTEFTEQVRLPRFLYQLKGIPDTKQPLVSIIIPAYQAANTIAATLKSVFEQTYKKFELIVVDDGSTDNLSELLKTFVSSIKYLQQPQSGAPIARNLGFDNSTGAYILFLDADTVLKPTAIEQMVIALETHSQIDFVYSDFYFAWKKFHLFEFSSEKLRYRNYIHTTSLMRRTIFPRFDPALKRFQDWDLWLTLDALKKRGLWIDQVLFQISQRSRQIGISTWLPSFVYQLPIIGQGRGSKLITKYRAAEMIIRTKHRL